MGESEWEGCLSSFCVPLCSFFFFLEVSHKLVLLCPGTGFTNTTEV